MYRFLFTVSQKMSGHGVDPTQRFTIQGWRTSSPTVPGSKITHISKICQFFITQNSKLYQGTSSVFLIGILHPLAFSIEKIPSGSSTFKLFLADSAVHCVQCDKNFDWKIRLGCPLSNDFIALNVPYNANIFLPIKTKILTIHFLQFNFDTEYLKAICSQISLKILEEFSWKTKSFGILLEFCM